MRSGFLHSGVTRSGPYLPWLWVLFWLFLFRVTAQAAQAVYSIPLLPPFGAWASGALPYWILLAFQLAILGVQIRTMLDMKAGRLRPQRRLGAILLLIGSLYFVGMAARLAMGLFVMPDHPWFGATLPAIFHLVLASFLLLVAHYHFAATGVSPTDRDRSVRRATASPPSRSSRTPEFERSVSRIAYPAVMALGIGVFFTLKDAGVSALVAAYIAAALGTVMVAGHEILFPYRREWRPTAREIRTDLVFMVTVQILLPNLISLGSIALGTLVIEQLGLSLDLAWPREWSTVAQFLLLIVLVELWRYWLHRGSHHLSFLWQLHAIHHSPRKLYWLNVGRFHPVEKALQFVVDSLPFLVLGVAPEVLALYFVFYAINGFYQHSNCNVRLGPLNYVVAGPELHRWHHARSPKDANVNFGNNLIVWDLLFGTWFLPRDRQVGELGLPNRRYPAGFLAQLVAPFRSTVKPSLSS